MSTPRHIRLNDKARVFYRDQLRSARAALLRDGEAYTEILFAVERLGAAMLGRPESLGAYQKPLSSLAAESVLAEDLPKDQPAAHLTFTRLFDLVRAARNEALHQGAAARHLGCRSVELALVLEDALMSGRTCIADYMVRAPLCAEGWQPLSLIRQHMLQNSFSYLPYLHNGERGKDWRLVSDAALASLLHSSDGNNDRRKLLGMSLETAVQSKLLKLTTPTIVSIHSTVADALGRDTARPILVVDDFRRLVGIATPFDLL